MRKEVKHYQGLEINIEVIAKLFAICAVRNFRVEGLIPYEEIDSIEEFCQCYNCEPQNVHVILGGDWFITYIDWEDSLEIVEWVSLECPKDKFRQSLEMLKYMIDILLQSKYRLIGAVMRHSSSYKFFELLKENGYIQELSDSIAIEDTIPDDIYQEIKSELKQKGNFETYLQDETRIQEYDEYFHHDLAFSLTDKFFKRYDHSQKNK